MDPIFPKVGIKFTSPMSSTSSVVLPDDPIEILGLDPTQEPGLTGLVDTKNLINVLLAPPHTHYIKRRSHGGNNNNCGSLSMHIQFTESSGDYWSQI